MQRPLVDLEAIEQQHTLNWLETLFVTNQMVVF